MTAVAEERAAQPRGFALDQNYPNPFNPRTTIEYTVGATSAVKLAIYDATGQEIRSLVDQTLTAGRYAIQWNGRTDAGEVVASGAYIHKLTAGAYVESRRLTLLK